MVMTRTRSGAVKRVNYRSLAGLKSTRTRKPRLSKPMATAVKKIAKSVVSRQAETKFISLRQDLGFNSTITGPAECYALMPSITQGTDDYQRIGDRISGRTLYIKGHINYNAAFLDTVGVNNYVPPSTVRVMILSQKNIKSNNQLGLVDTANLLKDNVATGAGRSYSGSMTDNLAPINKDLFKVHLDKKIKMNCVYQQSDGTGSSGWVGQKTAYFRCAIKLPKTLFYDTTNGDVPNNFAPFFCLGGVCDDGSSPFTLQTPYRVTFLSTAYFDDA